MKLKKNVSQKALKAKDCYEVVGGLGVGLVLLGYYLNANQHLSAWGTWIVGNLCVASYCFHKKAYSTGVMSLVIVLMSVYGYLKWMKIIG